MGRIKLKNNGDVDILLRRNDRARRLSLRVSALDGRVTLTVPPGASARQAQRFADDHADWIEHSLQKKVSPVVVTIGSAVPIDGRDYTVERGTGRSARLVDDRLLAPPSRVGPAIAALLKETARMRLVAASKRYAERIGRVVGRVTLRDTRSRWGSCSSDGNLMYSWRLILAPQDVLDYVAAHEVAHMKEMNHSPAFWSLVADLCPGYEAPRRWLRTDGHLLHRYRFESATDD